MTGLADGFYIFRIFARDDSIHKTNPTTAAAKTIIVTVGSGGGAGPGRRHRGKVKFKGKVSVH